MEADYENAVKTAGSGLELLKKMEASHGTHLPRKGSDLVSSFYLSDLFFRVRMAFQIALSVSLVKLFPPKHHVQALAILSDVLAQDPNNIPCLMSHGCILQHSNLWSEAENLFKRVGELEPDHNVALEAREERAWCIIQAGRLDEGGAELKEVVQALDDEEGKEEQKARAWWRLGKSFWKSGGT